MKDLMLNGEIREVREEDIENIYEICKQAELKNNPVAMAKYGFLVTAYSQHPEMKDVLKDCIGNYFYLYEKDKVLGFILGYSGQKWREHSLNWGDTNKGNIRWNSERLKEVGIENIDDIISKNNFAMLEKVAVDLKVRGRGISSQLFNQLFKDIQKDKTEYIFSEIVENVFKEGKSLGIKNEMSIKVHQKRGAVKVGESKEPWKYDKSFLGDKGTFFDGVYLFNLKQLTDFKLKRGGENYE